MIDRFLLYSLQHRRPIRVMCADTLKYMNLTVLSIEGDTLYYLKSGTKTPRQMPLNNLLSAGYARGDNGDPLENELKEGSL